MILSAEIVTADAELLMAFLSMAPDDFRDWAPTAPRPDPDLVLAAFRIVWQAEVGAHAGHGCEKDPAVFGHALIAELERGYAYARSL